LLRQQCHWQNTTEQESDRSRQRFKWCWSTYMYSALKTRSCKIVLLDHSLLCSVPVVKENYSWWCTVVLTLTALEGRGEGSASVTQFSW